MAMTDNIVLMTKDLKRYLHLMIVLGMVTWISYYKMRIVSGIIVRLASSLWVRNKAVFSGIIRTAKNQNTGGIYQYKNRIDQ